MLYQGVNVPLLKMGTVVDHGAGQAGTEEESEGVVEGADDSESRESMDLAESEKDLEESDEDDGEKTERNNKVLQNKKPTEECTANTLVVDGKKAGKKRDAREPAEVHKKKQKVSACK
jgi:glutaredoxin